MIRNVATLLATASLLLTLSSATAFAGETGTWTKKSFAVAGSWSIIEEGGRRYVELSDDFKTKSAPDLKIFLSTQSVAEVTGKNATRDAVLVGPLPRARGAVRLEIPEGTDLSQFTTLLLHCEQYSKLWAAAPLR